MIDSITQKAETTAAATAAVGWAHGLQGEALIFGLVGALVAQAFKPPAAEKAQIFSAILTMAGSIALAGLLSPAVSEWLIQWLNHQNYNIPTGYVLTLVSGLIGACGPQVLGRARAKIEGTNP